MKRIIVHCFYAAFLAWFAFCIGVYLLVPANQGFVTVVIPSFFRALSRLYLRFPEGFWLDLFYALISLALFSGIGWLFLRLFVRLPRLLEWCLAPFTGIGLVNFALVLPAMAFWLNLLTVLATLALFYAVVMLAARCWGWSTDSVLIEADPLREGAERICYWIAWALLAAITLLSFYHSLLFPVDYWDGLILYIHFSKLIYEEGGFPIMACLQVGLGLGANYPHLYSLWQAATATLFGHWSDLYGQLIPPLASVSAMVVIYYLVLYLYRDRFVAILATLAFRGLPFVTAYFIWESDYAMVMAYTGAFLLFLAFYLREPSLRRLQPLMLIGAIFPHLNYLGWIVWPSLALAMFWARVRKPYLSPSWIAITLTGALWFALAMIWYTRNWLLTGNPVYAFFPEIFGGININLEVLASCEQEWLHHGNGMAQLGDTLWERVAGTPNVILFDWRLAPWTAGLLVPAFFLFWKREHGAFFVNSALLLALYWLYQYVISGLYLYHTIAAFPILAVFAARMLASAPAPGWRIALAIPILFAGMVSGLPYAMMGPKTADPTLALFARPGLTPEQFYRMRYPEASQAWRWLNENAEEGAAILTHDNRYHVYRSDLRLLHLDDCELVPLYDSPYEEIHAELLRRGARYYLRIPGEVVHPITARLGHLPHLDDPRYYERILGEGGTVLYRIKGGG